MCTATEPDSTSVDSSGMNKSKQIEIKGIRRGDPYRREGKGLGIQQRKRRVERKWLQGWMIVLQVLHE